MEQENFFAGCEAGTDERGFRVPSNSFFRFLCCVVVFVVVRCGSWEGLARIVSWKGRGGRRDCGLLIIPPEGTGSWAL